MHQITTKYFGEMGYEEAAVVTFPDGIPGFEQERGFLPIRQPLSAPIVFLQSLATPGLCFATLPVESVRQGYELAVSPEDLEALGLPPDRQPNVGQEVICLTIISVAEDRSVTGNLLAPLVINLATGRGRQAIQTDTEYSHRQPLDAATGGPGCS